MSPAINSDVSCFQLLADWYPEGGGEIPAPSLPLSRGAEALVTPEYSETVTYALGLHNLMIFHPKLKGKPVPASMFHGPSK